MTEEKVRNLPGSSARSSAGRDENLSDQVQGTLRGAAESASELWDDAYDRGQRYYRQGTRAVGEIDPTALTGWLVAGAIGFGIGWLVFGAASHSDMTRRMAQSSSRHHR